MITQVKPYLGLPVYYSITGKVIRVILTTCYPWFSHILRIRKVGIDVNTLLITCLLGTGQIRHTSASEALVKTFSDKLTL